MVRKRRVPSDWYHVDAGQIVLRHFVVCIGRHPAAALYLVKKHLVPVVEGGGGSVMPKDLSLGDVQADYACCCARHAFNREGVNGAAPAPSAA